MFRHCCHRLRPARVTLGMAMSSYPVPCPVAVMAKALSSLVDASVLLPRLSPPASTASQFFLCFYPKSALMHFKPISSILPGAATESRIVPSLLWQLPPVWGGTGDIPLL